jgi:hypothetical protein
MISHGKLQKFKDNGYTDPSPSYKYEDKPLGQQNKLALRGDGKKIL